VYECRPLKEEITILYLISEPAKLRATDSPTARVVEEMQPIRTIRLLKWTEGWVQLGWREGAPDAPLRCGWLPTEGPIKDNPNVLGSDLLRISRTQVDLQQRSWPLAVKADILRGRPRVGFTAEQVIMAIGQPSSKFERESSTGTVEVWSYSGRAVVFANGKVLQIDTVR
jgi:hypothetical protein